MSKLSVYLYPNQINIKLMKFFRFIAFVPFVLTALWSCSKIDPQSQEGNNLPVEVSVSPSELNFTKSGGTQTLTVKIGGKWTTSIDASWVQLSQYGGGSVNGAIDVSVQANYDKARTATISFTSGKKTVSVSVSQTEGAPDDGIPRISIADFRKLKDSSSDWYRLTGEVVSISKQEYGDLYLMDDTGYIYVYGLAPEKNGANEDFSKIGIKAGDEITIIALKNTYNGIVETDKAYFESRQSGDYPGIIADRTLAGYLELPATAEGDGLTYVCHFDGNVRRNYSAYFNTEKRVSSWVCYPYCSSNKNDSRPDSYAYDPLIEPEHQADLTKSYQNRNFDGEEFVRGHMMPNASRGGRSQLDAFLSTNIMPQSSALNTGIWSSLEEMERKWVKNCDTLYIVVGTDCSQSKYQVNDNASTPKKITVPNAIYRAVLAYNKADDSYVGIAAYFENKKNAYADFTKTLPETMLMSIDKLEEKVGIDFFVNLPAAVGEAKAKAIEAADPSAESFWWN